MSPVGSDVLRKIMLFVLVLAGATQGWVQSTLTITGIIGACLILLSNLGSRTWHFMRWQPMKYTGRGSFFLAYLLAIGTGFILPYMGHRSIAIGGKGAMEYVITTSMLVAIVFMLSDFDGIQQFLVVGSDVSDTPLLLSSSPCSHLVEPPSCCSNVTKSMSMLVLGSGGWSQLYSHSCWCDKFLTRTKAQKRERNS